MSLRRDIDGRVKELRDYRQALSDLAAFLGTHPPYLGNPDELQPGIAECSRLLENGFTQAELNALSQAFTPFIAGGRAALNV